MTNNMFNLQIPDLYLPLFENQNDVVKYPHAILRTKSAEVNKNEDVKDIITNMSRIIQETNGVGLAAPQIGENKRIITVRRERKYTLINPIIIDFSETYISDEGCLSIPGLWGRVLRYKNITLKGLSPNGKEIILTLSDAEAVIPQHEIDHLDGILFFDKAIVDSLYWYADGLKPIKAELSSK